jgi:hypothetical protein
MLPELDCHRGSLPIVVRDAGRRQGTGSTPQGLFAALLCLALGLVSAGCSANFSSAAKVGSISVTNSSGKTGAVTQLSILDTLQLSMTPSQDSMSAGVDWTVTCGGNPRTGSTTGGACGTLVPAHTADGAATVYTAPSVVPINQAVTITATVTSNPSQTSSLTFTIVQSSIAVSIGIGKLTTPNTLPINQPANISYTVVNDPLDAGATLTATCGSAACGSFSGTKYTAPSAIPAGGTVTITATSVTDTTKSASVTLTIVNPPAPIPVMVILSPADLSVQTNGTGKLIAMVVSDPNPTAGIDWSVSCSAADCGGISAHTDSGAAAAYAAPTLAPPDGNVTITARSHTNSSVAASTTASIVTATPIVVKITSAPPGTMTAASTATLLATVTGNNLGVDWIATCATPGVCGSFSPTHTDGAQQTATYTAPSSIPAGGGQVILTASSSAPASTPSDPDLVSTTIVTQSPTLAFVQTPLATMTASAQAAVSAAVANDVAPGGVNWSVCEAPSASNSLPSNCGDSNYGYVYPPQTASGATAIYSAPPVSPGTSVVIMATSVANSSISIASSPIAIASITTPSINFVPSLPAKVQPNGTVNLMAAVANDSTNGGVDWQVCADNCGYFTIQPAIPAIAATATAPYQPPVAAVIAPSASGWPSGTPLPYTAPSQVPAAGNVTILAAAHVDNTKAVSGTIAIDTAPSGPALNGKVTAGIAKPGVTGTIQPVAGSLVSLYVAGINGTVNKVTNGVVEIEYSVQATEIASATSGKDGSFTIPAGYDCPSPSSQMYLVASGGSAGTGSPNANLALMTALGSCSNLSSTPVAVNEVTTIASTFAIGPFSANDALYGTSSYLYLGTSSTNITGLINAFAAVNNLVDITTGQARFVTPAGNGSIPYAYINYLADILNACVVTSGGVEGDGSACGTLLLGTDLLNADGLRAGASPNSYLGSIAAPADTLQAAFNLAQVMRYSGTTNQYEITTQGSADVWNLATTASPFQPIQALASSTTGTSNPISIHYVGGGGISSGSTVGSLAVDASGNVWITDARNGTVAEWNVAGSPLSPSTGFPAVGVSATPITAPMAIDASGNVWVSGNGKLAELTPYGTQAPASPFKGVAGGGSQVAIDKQGNIWLANYSGVAEFDSTGAYVSPAAGFANTGVIDITSVGVDSSDNIDIAFANSAGGPSLGLLTNPAGNLIVSTASIGSENILSVLPYFAADSQGDIWETEFASFFKYPPYTGNADLWTSSSGFPYQEAGQGGGVVAPGGVALDGRGAAWVADQGFANSQYPTYLASPELFVAYPGGSYQYIPASSFAAGPSSVTIDASGNIWVLLSDNSVTEFVGEATPVVAPVALGLKNNKLATMP